MYSVNRTQAETDSNIWILDAYGHLRFNGLLLEGEVLNISGKTNAIKLAGGDGDNPLYKEVDIWGYVARAGYEQSAYSMIFETGYASGDDDVNDDRFTGRSLHSDHNVGLLLYEEVLSRVSAAAFPGDASSLARTAASTTLDTYTHTSSFGRARTSSSSLHTWWPGLTRRTVR